MSDNSYRDGFLISGWIAFSISVIVLANRIDDHESRIKALGKEIQESKATANHERYKFEVCMNERKAK